MQCRCKLCHSNGCLRLVTFDCHVAPQEAGFRHRKRPGVETWSADVYPWSQLKVCPFATRDSKSSDVLNGRYAAPVDLRILVDFDIFWRLKGLAIPTWNPAEVLREVSRLSTPEASNPDAACPLSQRAIGHSGSLWCLGSSTYCAFPIAAWGNKDLLSCSNSCLMSKSQSSSIPVDRCLDP